ncbi:MAG: putative toxin-antitoxin system toxin component, PIN family [Chloroflexota bacterium]
MRAVLDANVLIAAVLSPRGTPARLLLAWQVGAFELVVSPLLLTELRRALAYPKLARLVPPADAEAFAAWLGRAAHLAADPPGLPRVRSEDPDDDYLIALAAAERAVLVSGDGHLTMLAAQIPVRTPAAFLTELEDRGRPPGTAPAGGAGASG